MLIRRCSLNDVSHIFNKSNSIISSCLLKALAILTWGVRGLNAVKTVFMGALTKKLLSRIADFGC